MPEYKTGSTPTVNQNGTIDVAFPRGAVQKFTYVFSFYSGWQHIYLGQHIDRLGRTLTLNYGQANGKVILNSLVDHDNRVTAFGYWNPNYADRITSVTDPYGRSVGIAYDSSGRLVSITDAAGITSSFTYDIQGWMTSYATPYGTTSFSHTGTALGFLQEPPYIVNRACTITEADGNKQLVLYRDNSYYLNPNNQTVLVPSAWPAEDRPTLPFPNFIDGAATHARNSFRWNRKQYMGLNAGFKVSGNFNDLSVTDYKIARMSHWNHKGQSGPLDRVGGTLSMLREPSPDGFIDGQTIWYDYPGRQFELLEGTMPVPSVIAKVLPDSQTWYRRYTLNSMRRPTAVTETYGDGLSTRTFTLAYSADGRNLLSITGPNNELLRTYTYTGYKIATQTDHTGTASYTTTYTYDALGRISQISTPTGLTRTLTYGQNGFVSTVTDQPINTVNQYTYAGSFLSSHTDPRGFNRTFTWDNLQRLTRIDYPDATYETFTYTLLDLTSHRDRLGNVSSYGYNPVRQMISMTDARNNQTTFTYCGCGSVESITNPLQQTTQFSYDYNGRLVTTLLPDNTSVSRLYDRAGRLISQSDGLQLLTYTYNNQSLLTAINNPFGTIRSIIYDNLDRPITITDERGVTVTQTFDRLDRILTRSWPDGGQESFAYSARGLTSHTDQLNKVTTYAYDEAGRKTSETTPNNELISFTYNTAGDLLTLVDGKNQTTKWDFDSEGRVWKKYYANDLVNPKITYGYDANDRLTSRWTAAKGTTTYSYDPTDNLTLINYPSSPDISFIYDALNRVSSMTDASGTTTFSYTTAGNLLTENGPWVNDTVSFSYHASVPRLRTGLSLEQPTSPVSYWSQTFAYDGARRLQIGTSPAGTFTYDYFDEATQATSPAPMVRKLTLPNTSFIEYDYDNVARMTSTALRKNDGTVLNSHAYLYNVRHERTRQTRTDASFVNYGYDHFGQLDTASGSGGQSTENLNYDYDPAWNMTQRVSAGVGITYTVNNLNQVTAENGNS
ncbi:MAG: hypothetical protein AB1813_23505, partial [Verrucomicrobiota bacterium]